MNLNKYKYTHIPTHYLATQELDERFLLMKVYVLHTGENYNGSIFEKEVVEKAIPSLANTPILAFIKMDNEKDFAGHEIDLVVENGEYKWKYKGQAYGVIPERNNARWEFMKGTDGIEREYLVVDAIVWKKFEDAVEIMSRDLIKGQSMELSQKYSGHFNDKGLFVFDQFKFDGCAILGNNVEPAMNSAKVEMQFSMADIKNNINEMLLEYNSKFLKEVEDVNIEELLKEFGLTREQVVEAGIEIHNYNDSNIEKFKEELERIMREADKEGNVREKIDSVDDLNKDEIINPSEKDIIADKDVDKDKDKDNDVEKTEFDDKNQKAEGEEDEQKALEKNKGNDNKDLEKNRKSHEEKRNSENDSDNDNKNEKDLKDKFEKLETLYSEVVKERDDLLTYKKNRERQDHKGKVEALISTFEKLDENDVKEIKEKVFHFSYEEIEEKLYAILGKKQIGEKVKKQSQFAKFYVANDVDNEEKKPSYDHLFRKHLNK